MPSKSGKRSRSKSPASKKRSTQKRSSSSKKPKAPRHLKPKTARKQTAAKRKFCRNAPFELLKTIGKELGYKQTSRNRLCGKLGQRLTLEQMMEEAKRHH